MERQDLSCRTLANEWPFRRMYLRTHIPLTRPDAVPCSRPQRVPGHLGQAIQIWERSSMSTAKSSRLRL
jgi:hypothetical protein